MEGTDEDTDGGRDLCILEPGVCFFNIFCLYSTDFLLQADYVTGTETTRPPTNYDRAQDVSADTSPFIGMFFFIFLFLFLLTNLII